MSLSFKIKLKTDMAHRTQILKYIYSLVKFCCHNYSSYKCLSWWNLKKQIQRRSYTIGIERCSIPCFGTVQGFAKEYTHICEAEYLEPLRSTALKLETAPNTRNPPSRARPLDRLLLCWVPKVSWYRARHYRSAWDLRLQEALRSRSQDSQMQDYIL